MSPFQYTVVISPVTAQSEDGQSFFAPSLCLSGLLSDIAQIAYNFLGSRQYSGPLLFVTTEHAQALPDVMVNANMNNAPTQAKRLCQIPQDVYIEDATDIQKLSMTYPNDVFITNSYVQLVDKSNSTLQQFYQGNIDTSYYQSLINDQGNYGFQYTDLGTRLQNGLRSSLFLQVQNQQANYWGNVNLSSYYCRGQNAHKFKTFQSGWYTSRGLDLFNLSDVSNNLVYRYMSNCYPLYFNGLPQGMVNVNGYTFLSQICADAISGLWNTTEIQKLQNNLNQIPIIIQGDAMSPGNFFKNVFNLYCKYWGMNFSYTYGSSDPNSMYPDMVELTFSSMNDWNALLQHNKYAAWVLFALIKCPYIVFADTFAYSVNNALAPHGGVYHYTNFDINPLKVRFSKTQQIWNQEITTINAFPGNKVNVSIHSNS